MSVSVNTVLIAGNLTRNPEQRQAGSAVVASFGIALNRSFKKADGTKGEEVTFVDVEAWGKTAELCMQYLTKGRAVLVEGRLKLDTWEDPAKGKREKMKVVADGIHFLSPPVGSNGADPSHAPAAGADDPF